MVELYKILRTFQISPKIAIHKFTELLIKKIVKSKNNIDADSQYTFDDNEDLSALKIGNIVSMPSDEYLIANSEIIIKLGEHFLNHRFNLLGSGFVFAGFCKPKDEIEELIYSSELINIDKDNFAYELVNKANMAKSKEILNLINKYNPDYKLIDWQRDHKSGFRWKEKLCYKQIKYGKDLAADIKMPWELGRMQDLLILAYLYRLSELRITNKHTVDYKNEFISRMLDFIGSNPPKFGAQWGCAMDVSIRLTNMLTTYDFFISSNCKFDNVFNELFFNSVHSHISFIKENLEWSSGMRGNHYYTNITGLLVAFAHLSIDDNSAINYINNNDLAHYMNQFAQETLYQFNKDGSNFEASIPYHFLCVEMMLFSINYINSFSLKVINNIQNKLNTKYFIFENGNLKFSSILNQRINSIINFTKSVITKDNYSFNIGDNDSGKYLKLYTYYKLSDNALIDDLNNYSQIIDMIDNLIIQDSSVFEYQIESIKENEIEKYKDFGLYLFRNRDYFAALRCGNIGQRAKGGHSHNDQLSLLLKVNNADIFVDNGTYLYTPDPSMRNIFRSTFMHNTLSIENIEQNDWANNNADDLFWFKNNKAKAEILSLNKNQIVAVHHGYKQECKREIEFNEFHIEGTDYLEMNVEKQIHFYLNPEINDIKVYKNCCTIRFAEYIIKLEVLTDNADLSLFDYLHSPSYGLLIQAKELRITCDNNIIKWKIEFEKDLNWE